MDDTTPSVQGPGRWKHAFLWFLLCLVALNVVMAVRLGRYDQTAFFNLVIALGLLFNHVAFQYTKTGWPSTVMKGLAWVWMGLMILMTVWVVVGWMTPAPRI